MNAKKDFFIGTAAWSLPKDSAPTFPGEGSHLERYSRTLNAVSSEELAHSLRGISSLGIKWGVLLVQLPSSLELKKKSGENLLAKSSAHETDMEHQSKVLRHSCGVKTPPAVRLIRVRAHDVYVGPYASNGVVKLFGAPRSHQSPRRGSLRPSFEPSMFLFDDSA